MIRRILASLLSVLILAPSGVFAQSLRAGVVTTLEGNVTARRVALPAPVALKFKDDVFQQDTVTTGDKSLARMLLGGKAVVTVRERSVLTITETPNRSTIDLDSGKFALAVAREKMRPGEEIQIRTPNAVAGVRGTVVITEVNRQSAQAGGPAPAVLTNFYVLRGTITAQPLDPGTRQPMGTPLNVGAMQAYSGAGTSAPRVAPVPAEQVGQITSGLQPSGPKGGADAGAEQIKTQAVQTATALLSTLTGQASAVLAPAPQVVTTTSVQTSTTAPINAVTSSQSDIESLVKKKDETASTPAPAALVTSFSGPFTSTSSNPIFTFTKQTIVQNGNFVSVTSGAAVNIAGPLAAFIDSVLIATGSLFAITGGSLTSSTPSPLFSLDPTVITTVDALFAMNGGTMTLSGPLVTDVNGILTSAGELLRLQNSATLTSTSGGALIQLTGTSVAATGALAMTGSSMTLAGPLYTGSGLLAGSGTSTTGPIFSLAGSTLTSTGTSPLIQVSSTSSFNNEDNFLRLAGGSTMSLRGSLLKSTNVASAFSNIGRSFIAVVDGSSLVTASTNEALMVFDGASPSTSKLAAARNFFVISFSSTTSSPSMTLSGPFLSATNTALKSGNPASDTFSFLAIRDGAQVTSTSTSPFMTLTSSSIDTAGDVLSLRRSTTSTPSRLTLAGPLLSATNSSLNHTSLGFGASFSTSPTACCSGSSSARAPS